MEGELESGVNGQVFTSKIRCHQISESSSKDKIAQVLICSGFSMSLQSL